MGCYEEGRAYEVRGERVELIKEMDKWDKDYKDALVYDREANLYKLIDKDYLEEVAEREVELGLLVKGLESADDRYVWTDSKMKAGMVEEINGGDVRIRVIKHSKERAVGRTYKVNKNTFFDYFEEMSVEDVFSVGDFVRGISDNYNYTDKDMLAAEIVDEDRDDFLLKIVKHEESYPEGHRYWINKYNFANEFVLIDNPVPFQPEVSVGDRIKIIEVSEFYIHHGINLDEELIVVAGGEDNLIAQGLLPCGDTFVVQSKVDGKLYRIGYYGEKGNWEVL